MDNATQRIFSGFVNNIGSLASRISRQNQLINELQGKVANLETDVVELKRLLGIKDES